MSAVDLSAIPVASAQFALPDFGGMLVPPLGGPEQRVDRPGSRTAITYSTPPMRYEPDGRRWAARLARAQQGGALMEIPQPDPVIGTPGAPVVSTNIAAGKLIPLAGLTAGYTVREGQWLSIIVAGHRYAYQAASDAVASGGGTVTVTSRTLLRTPLAGGETVEIAKPMIEGWLQDFAWPADRARTTQFEFTVSEAA